MSKINQQWWLSGEIRSNPVETCANHAKLCQQSINNRGFVPKGSADSDWAPIALPLSPTSNYVFSQGVPQQPST